MVRRPSRRRTRRGISVATRRRAAWAACLVVVALDVGCAPEPPEARPPAGPEPYEVQLESLPGGGLALSVEISGGPHRLLFDPGAGLTLLTPALAEALGCRPWGRLVLHSPRNGPRSLRRCGEMSLSLGALSLSAPTAVLDPVPEGVAAASLGGVASLQTLGARPVTLDLAAPRIVLESDASLEARVAGMRPVEVRVGREAAGLATRVFVAVGTPRGPLWLLAGGAGGPLTVAPHALPFLGAAPDAAPGAEVTVSLELPGLGRLERAAVVADGPWDGVLDAATLARLVLSVDLRDGRAWARWAEP